MRSMQSMSKRQAATQPTHNNNDNDNRNRNNNNNIDPSKVHQSQELAVGCREPLKVYCKSTRQSSVCNDETILQPAAAAVVAGLQIKTKSSTRANWLRTNDYASDFDRERLRFWRRSKSEVTTTCCSPVSSSSSTTSSSSLLLASSSKQASLHSDKACGFGFGICGSASSDSDIYQSSACTFAHATSSYETSDDKCARAGATSGIRDYNACNQFSSRAKCRTTTTTTTSLSIDRNINSERFQFNHKYRGTYPRTTTTPTTTAANARCLHTIKPSNHHLKLVNNSSNHQLKRCHKHLTSAPISTQPSSSSTSSASIGRQFTSGRSWTNSDSSSGDGSWGSCGSGSSYSTSYTWHIDPSQPRKRMQLKRLQLQETTTADNTNTRQKTEGTTGIQMRPINNKDNGSCQRRSIKTTSPNHSDCANSSPSDNYLPCECLLAGRFNYDTKTSETTLCSPSSSNITTTKDKPLTEEQQQQQQLKLEQEQGNESEIELETTRTTKTISRTRDINKEQEELEGPAEQVGDNSSSSSDYCSDSLDSSLLITANCLGAGTSGTCVAETTSKDKSTTVTTDQIPTTVTIKQIDDKVPSIATNTCHLLNVSPGQSSLELSCAVSSSSSSSSCGSSSCDEINLTTTIDNKLLLADNTCRRIETVAAKAANHRYKGEEEETDLDTTVATSLGGEQRHAPSGVVGPFCGMDTTFCNQSLEDRLKIVPLNKGGYPNNTLIVDLKKCHKNITSLWPSHKTNGARFGSIRSWFSLSNCLPAFCLAGDDTASYKPNKPRARRRPRLQFHMPDPLLRTDVSLKLDEYDKALSVLTSDIRYHLHLILYRRVRTVWLLFSTLLCILMPILFTNLESLIILSALSSWLGLQIAGAFLTTRLRTKLDQMLEKSVAQVNSFLMDHNLMLGVINVGCLFSKSKLIIPMLYFDTSQCREQIESIISIDSKKDAESIKENTKRLILDYSRIDLPLDRPNSMAFAQSMAKKIILRYSQRWISYFDKRKLMFTDDRIRPRHLSTGKCLCQFIEEHFGNQTETYTRHQEKAETLDEEGLHPKQRRQINETHVRQKVKENQEAKNALPTISELVSRRDCPPVAARAPSENHLTINMNEKDTHEVAHKSGQQHLPKQNGFTILNSWHHLLDSKHDTVVDISNISTANNNQQQTPTASSPDLSLEMGCESIGRSDELVKKLRQLLELKKNDLQGLEGSVIFSDALTKAHLLNSPLMPIPNDLPSSVNMINNGSLIDQKSGSLGSRKVEHDKAEITNVKSYGNKRFFAQKDGLFFFGGGKKNQSQQEQHTNTRQDVLEIC